MEKTQKRKFPREEEMTHLNLYLPMRLVAPIKERARREGKSISWLMEDFIEKNFDFFTKKSKKE